VCVCVHARMYFSNNHNVLQEYYPTHIPQLLCSLLNMICKHCSTLTQQGHLIESLNAVSELSIHLQDQSIQRNSASSSKSNTPSLNRRCSSSPDNVANVTREEDQTATKNHTNTSTPNNRHKEGVDDVVKSYLELFPRLVFDVMKLTCFNQLYTTVWKGTGNVLEIFKISCDLLMEILSFTPPGKLGCDHGR